MMVSVIAFATALAFGISQGKFQLKQESMRITALTNNAFPLFCMYNIAKWHYKYWWQKLLLL